MKTNNILYWTFTGIICALMLFSAISSLTNNPQGAEVFKHLGYPIYFGILLAIAKILGVIALLTPGFPKLKEWAYAGFAYDMIFAAYSFISVGEAISNWVFVIVMLGILALSYVYYHKKLKAV